MSIFDGTRNLTDDRGVFRVYGLAPGAYRVSVGQVASAEGAISIVGIGGSQYAKTFYPGATDELKAAIIRVNEGTEATNIDIILANRLVDSRFPAEWSMRSRDNR